MAGTDRRLIVLLGGLVAAIGTIVLLAGGVFQGIPAPSAPSPPSIGAEERAASIAAQEREIGHLRQMRRQFRWGLENLQRNLAFVRYQQDLLKQETARVFGPAPPDHPLLAGLATRLGRLPEQHEAFRRAEAQVRARLAVLEADLATREAAYAGDAASALSGF